MGLRIFRFLARAEKCTTTGLLVSYVPGFPGGAPTQGETWEEVHSNLEEVISMILEDGEPTLEAEFVGTQTVAV